MIILGIDPGLTMTGVAVYDTGTDSFLDVYAVRGPSGMAVEDKCRSITDHVYAYMDQYKPGMMAIEENHVAPGRARSALKQREVIGSLCERWRGDVMRIAPAQAKKVFTGSGKATKDQMVEVASRHLFIGDLNKSAKEAVADAMGVCMACAEEVYGNG